MQRRRFLALAGLGLGTALADPRHLLAATDARARFAAAVARHPWLLGWADAQPLPGWQPARREGDWPAELAGILYRNGPGVFRRGDLAYRHWFDGDGLLQAWRINRDGISHQARFVPTSKFAQEEAAGRFLLPAIGTHIPDARRIRNGDDLNTANTAVIQHAGALYALWEGGSAFAFTPQSLQPQGFHSWGEGLEHLPFSAHPLHDADGTLWNFGLFGQRLLLWQIDARGQPAPPRLFDLPFAGYLHAFSMNDRYLVFILMPYVLDGDLDGRPYFEALSWQPGRGCRALVVDKQDPGRTRWFGLPAGAAYHFGPLRQVGETLLLPACWHDDGEVVRSPLADAVAGEPLATRPPPGRLQTIALDLRSGRASLPEAVAVEVDFPVWDSHGDGRRFYAPLISGRHEHAYFDALSCLDVDRGVVDRYDFDANLLVEEHRLLVDTAGRRWLLGTVLDVARRRSGLLLFAADNLAAGPRAAAWLEQALPLGFHGHFVAAPG